MNTELIEKATKLQGLLDEARALACELNDGESRLSRVALGNIEEVISAIETSSDVMEHVQGNLKYWAKQIQAR